MEIDFWNLLMLIETLYGFFLLRFLWKRGLIK